jgi:adenylate cyclase
MAFWNAPTDQPDHRHLAIKAAHSMNEALDEFNSQTEGDLDFKLEIGIGINSGNCIVGNMGSDKRFDYTVLGDAVNLASRLESQSSNYGLHMIMGENTYLEESELTIIEIDRIAVKGKSSAETIYTCFKPEIKITEEFLKKHEAFLIEYRAQNWDGAKLLIDELIPISGELELYYKHMKARIEEYIAHPPASDWEGVFVAKNK